MVKIVDVAREAGTSVATVSRALNNNDRVDPELVRRVKAAAKKLGYKPNAVARNLRRQRTSLWLLIISDIENAFFTSVARGVEDVASQNGFSVVLCNADEDEGKEARYVDLATAEQAAGVILSPHSSHNHVGRLVANSIPVVVIDRSVAAEVDSVRGDSRAGARMATEHLLEQGWERPACVTGPRSAETAELRRLGYQDALDRGRYRDGRGSHPSSSPSRVAGRERPGCSIGGADHPTRSSPATPRWQSVSCKNFELAICGQVATSGWCASTIHRGHRSSTRR